MWFDFDLNEIKWNKNNWQEADQLAIYKRGRGVELRATEKQLQLAAWVGLETGTSGFSSLAP